MLGTNWYSHVFLYFGSGHNFLKDSEYADIFENKVYAATVAFYVCGGVFLDS